MTTAHPTTGESTPGSASSDPQGSGGHERQRPSYDDVNTPVIVLVGVISAIITFLIIAFVEGLCWHWSNRLIQERNYDVANPRQVKIIDDQKSKLVGEGVPGAISVEQVMGDVVAKYAKRTGKKAGATNQGGAEDQPEEDN